jgi:tyrosinase
VDLTRTIQQLKKSGELKVGTPLSLQLVPTRFGAKFEREDTELVLSSLDVIVTPVIVNPAPR